MRRREFVTLLCSVAAWPPVARAQQLDRVRRIAVLMSSAESDPERQKELRAFQEGLQELGWIDGRNIQIDIRWAPDLESMQRFAKDLVALHPDVILAPTTSATQSILQQTHTIPIIFTVSNDPVGSGFVQSFPKPGGNVTGFTNMEPTTATKWLELLKEIAPHVNRVAILFNPATAPYFKYYLNPLKASAPSFGVEAIAAPIGDMFGLETAIAAQAREPNGGLIMLPDFFTFSHLTEVTSLWNQTHDLKCLLDLLDIEQAVILAVAMSTTIGTTFTLQYPERVKALVLCSWYELDGFPLLEGRRKTHQMSFADLHLRMREVLLERGRRGLEDYLEENYRMIMPIFPFDKPEVRRKLVELFACHAPEHYVQSAEFYTSMPNLRGQLHRIQCPILGICGSDDPSPDNPELLKHVPNFRQEWLPGARRFTMMEYPDRFNAIVDRFLASLH